MWLLHIARDKCVIFAEEDRKILVTPVSIIEYIHSEEVCKRYHGKIIQKVYYPLNPTYSIHKNV